MKKLFLGVNFVGANAGMVTTNSIGIDATYLFKKNLELSGNFNVGEPISGSVKDIVGKRKFWKWEIGNTFYLNKEIKEKNANVGLKLKKGSASSYLYNETKSAPVVLPIFVKTGVRSGFFYFKTPSVNTYSVESDATAILIPVGLYDYSSFGIYAGMSYSILQHTVITSDIFTNSGKSAKQVLYADITLGFLGSATYQYQNTVELSEDNYSWKRVGFRLGYDYKFKNARNKLLGFGLSSEVGLRPMPKLDGTEATASFSEKNHFYANVTLSVVLIRNLKFWKGLLRGE